MNIEISVDAGKVERLLRDLPDRFDAARRKALMDIGQAVSSHAETAFRTTSFRPSPWASRKSTKKSDLGRPLLYKSGVMKRDIDYHLQGPDTVVIGTPHNYAKFHQFGTKHMPARPFLPIDKAGKLVPEVERKIAKIVDRAVSDALGGV